MTTETILSLGKRKIVKWGQGYVVFLTKEAKEFGWDDKTLVNIAAIRDNEGNSIVVRKIK